MPGWRRKARIALDIVKDKVAGPGEPPLKPGDPAPEFQAVDQDGNPVALADLRGRKVVLWFYPMADTPG